MTSRLRTRLLRTASRTLCSGLLLLPLASWGATYCQTSNLTANLGVQSLSAGADANTIGQQIGNESKPEGRIFDGNSNAQCRMVRSWATPARPVVPGVFYQSGGKTYPVFETGIAGIGYAIGISDRKSYDYQPLQAQGNTPTYSGSPTVTMGFNIQVVFVATGRLQSGTYNMPYTQLANFYVETANGNVEGGAYIQANATFDINAITCTLHGANAYTMTLPPVSVNDFANVAIGSAPSNVGASNAINLNLSCPAGISLYATMTDNNDPGSTKNYLSPGSGDGIAQGIGIQMFRDGSSTPISMGPDSSAAGNTNQWYIGSADSDVGRLLRTSLQAKYVRTAQTMKAGEVRAVATVTFSYR